MAEIGDDRLAPGRRAEILHGAATVIDLHCDTIGRFLAGEDLRLDLPGGHVDIPKLKRGGVDGEVFACFSPPPATEREAAAAAAGVLRQIEGVYRLAAQNPADLEVVTSRSGLSRLRGSGKTAILIGIEGGYAIQDDLDLLRSFHRLGVRLMTLTHRTGTDWADASGDPGPVHGGLTPFGEDVVREMNRLGMIVDVSHASDETVRGVLAVTSAPVVASHSCCRALARHFRNLDDDLLAALARNGGLVGVCFAPGFLSEAADRTRRALWEEIVAAYGLPADFRRALRADPERKNPGWAEFDRRQSTLERVSAEVDVRTVADHIDHIVRVTGGARHVGLGSDFDGIGTTPSGLEDIGRLPALTAELLRRGYGEAAIRGVQGGNFLRLWTAVERAAKR